MNNEIKQNIERLDKAFNIFIDAIGIDKDNVYISDGNPWHRYRHVNEFINGTYYDVCFQCFRNSEP